MGEEGKAGLRDVSSALDCFGSGFESQVWTAASADERRSEKSGLILGLARVRHLGHVDIGSAGGLKVPRPTPTTGGQRGGDGHTRRANVDLQGAVEPSDFLEDNK